jgi:hypothetical protein
VRQHPDSCKIEIIRAEHTLDVHLLNIAAPFTLASVDWIAGPQRADWVCVSGVFTKTSLKNNENMGLETGNVKSEEAVPRLYSSY